MAPIWPWLGALLALPLALAGKHGDAVPKSYIVEFSNPHILNLERDLSFALFHGGSFSLLGDTKNEAAIVKKISSFSGIKSIAPVREAHLPARQVSVTHDASSTNHAHRLSRRGVGYSIGSNDVPHRMTGVDKLREEGYLGSGLRVAVVDSGVDYKHPALGGLIAAQPNPYNFTGVAPNVTLGHYKVASCAKSSSTDLIMEAFKMAYEAKADIITTSIGGYSGWSEEPWGVLIQRIVQAGVPCMVAVGNDGQHGMFYASDGANGKGAIGVGAVNNLMAPMLLNKATYSTRNSTKEFGWSISGDADFVNGTYQLYPLSLNTSVENDGCQVLSSSTPDLSKKIVLIRRGGCSFENKALNAVNAGAKNILFYNNAPGTDQFSFTKHGLTGIGMVPTGTGDERVRLAAKNTTIVLRMISKKYASTIFVNEVNSQAGGFMSDFTQWGPSNELAQLPSLAAPGGFMISTYPLALGGYAVESGTSMATPYFAGCIALLMEARGKTSPGVIQSLFSTNANPNVFNDGVSTYEWLDSVAQQGAGLINAYDAVHSKTIFNVSSISFNDTEHIAPVYFSINNTGSENILYTIDQVGSGTVYTLADDGTTTPVFFDSGDFMETLTEYASLTFSSRLVSISPGQTAVVKVTATPPKGLDATRIPIYSGYVTLNGTNGDSFSISYLGAANSMRDVTILDTKYGDNYLYSSASSTHVQANDLFTLPAPGTTGNNISYPIFKLSSSMGTSLLDIDVKANNGTVLGSVPGYPKHFLSRSATGSTQVSWSGELADGTYVANGIYSLRVRALKIFGDLKNDADYDVVETPRFRIQYEGSESLKARRHW
ncbi:hypothetical protein N7507_004618 [Penicillium longicatenatum]|nr:hypothetical protein N7507_004618 [Penicillium longicatenatum]